MRATASPSPRTPRSSRYGSYADGILATARRTEDSPPNDQVLVACLPPGLRLEPTSEWNTLGFRGTCSPGFMLDADGPLDLVLDDPYGDISAQTMLPTSHVLWASVWLGLASEAVDRARRFVRAAARAKPGVHNPAAVRLAELMAVYQQMADLVHSAARLVDESADDPERRGSLSFAIQMNTLKISSSTLVVEIVHRATLICGIAGYREDTPYRMGRLHPRRLRRGLDGQQRPHHHQQRPAAARGQGLTVVTASPARQAFRDELVGAGLLVTTGVDGLYLRSGELEDLVDALDRYATRLGEDDRAEHPHQPDAWRLRLPPVMARSVFERTDYLASFPHLVGAVSTFTGDDRAHADLLARHAAGQDWTPGLVPAETVLVPAACHAVYPQLTGTLPDDGRLVDVLATCFRHEPSQDPARMQVFRMREFVRVGTPEQAVVHRDRWVRRALDALLALGLEARQVAANDPFFGRAGRMLAVNQRDEALKYEIEVPVFGPDEPGTAVASSNYHQSHFGVNFDIRSPDGQPAHSACVGFGLERIALALLSAHGTETGAWPVEVRGLLWP